MLKIAACLSLVLSFSASATLISPQDLTALTTSSPLVYKGKFETPGSSSGSESCVFENDATVVIADYCTKAEIPVAGLHVLPKHEKTMMNFYLEVDGDPYAARRDSYDTSFWRVGIVQQAAACKEGMSLTEHAACLEATNRNWTCSILTIQPLGTLNRCNDKDPTLAADVGLAWLSDARAFYDAPTAPWYELLANVKTLITANLE